MIQYVISSELKLGSDPSDADHEGLDHSDLRSHLHLFSRALPDGHPQHCNGLLQHHCKSRRSHCLLRRYVGCKFFFVFPFFFNKKCVENPER